MIFSQNGNKTKQYRNDSMSRPILFKLIRYGNVAIIYLTIYLLYNIVCKKQFYYAVPETQRNLSITIVVSGGHYGPPINMVDYTPRPIIISGIKAIYWTNELDELRSDTILEMHEKQIQSQNCNRNRRIKRDGKYDQLHIMTSYPTKYESCLTTDLKGVAFTM